MNSVLRPQPGFKGLAAMGRKLASSYFKHWWKYTSRDDLRNPCVAEAIRRDIARNFKSAVEMLIQDASIKPRLALSTPAAAVMAPPARHPTRFSSPMDVERSSGGTA